MRKNLPDRKLSRKEMEDLKKHHYEKPNHICECGCGYHKDTCMKLVQEQFKQQQEEKKKEKEEKDHIIDGGSSFDYETK